MERRPDTPNALIDTGDGLAQLPVLLAIAIAQHLGLFPDALVLQVLDADGASGAVDVVGDDDGVLAGPWADGELDGGVARRKRGERRLDEGVHALGGAPPVAVVELEALALEDEGADAVLGPLAGVCVERGRLEAAYLGLCDRPGRSERHVGGERRGGDVPWCCGSLVASQNAKIFSRVGWR